MATKTYTIPLRKAFQQAAPFKRAPKAVRAIKIYLRKHCKVEEVKIGAKLNTLLWARGITRPPHKVVVNVIVADGLAKAELEGFAYEEAKKVQKKQEPQSLKEKIQDKIGAPKQEKAPVKEKEPLAPEKEVAVKEASKVAPKKETENVKQAPVKKKPAPAPEKKD